jgi:hypothetical protein
MEKELRIKQCFRGSKSQLIYLGREATKLYKELYNIDPNKIKVENEAWEYENVYPISILKLLPKPVKNEITDIYCQPKIQRSTVEYPITHGWECKYMEYNEFSIEYRNTISGKLINIPIIKKDGLINYSFTFDLQGKYTFHINLKNSNTARKIINSLINCNINDNITINIETGKDGWANVDVFVNNVKKNLKDCTLEDLKNKYNV